MMDHATFQMMVNVSAANPQYHDLFHVVTPEDYSMIQEAREFSNVVLRGVGSSICSDVPTVYGCSAAKPVGDVLEGLLWFGLMECPPESEACQMAREFFWLARDVREIFLVGQKYKIYACPHYDKEQLQEVVRKLRGIEVGLGPSR